ISRILSTRPFEFPTPLSFLRPRAGLDPAAMVQALAGGAAASWMLAEQAPRMQRRDFAPGFMVRLQQKDLRLALASAARLGVPLPTTALVHQLFAAVRPTAAATSGRRRSSPRSRRWRARLPSLRGRDEGPDL